MGRPLQTLTPAQTREVQEVAEQIREGMAAVTKGQARLVKLAERLGTSAVAREARKTLGTGVSRQSLEKRIAGRS